ncbi:MAG: hypothetical protein SO096_10280 [Prevotella sp.]|nr:hypothetical protein [Bacteroidales bacterium]MDY4950978.1 hypothetical protein [Prevotella sp.]MCI6102624.1 hypothetical protein [Bacteroidales bacterium]MCI7654623.1 hypothetical protein [Bacteroidales bacterium]MDD7705171.1 hypothetical protein [Bacteroidales bacterium]
MIPPGFGQYLSSGMTLFKPLAPFRYKKSFFGRNNGILAVELPEKKLPSSHGRHTVRTPSTGDAPHPTTGTQTEGNGIKTGDFTIFFVGSDIGFGK